MKNLLSAIGAFLFASVIVLLIAVWLGVGSGLIDPHKLVPGPAKRPYPDYLISEKGVRK